MIATGEEAVAQRKVSSGILMVDYRCFKKQDLVLVQWYLRVT